MYIKKLYKSYRDLFLPNVQNQLGYGYDIHRLGVLNETLPTLLDLYKEKIITKKSISVFSIYNMVIHIEHEIYKVKNNYLEQNSEEVIHIDFNSDDIFSKFEEGKQTNKKDNEVDEFKELKNIINNKLLTIWEELSSTTTKDNYHDSIWEPTELPEYPYTAHTKKECHVIFCVLFHHLLFSKSDWTTWMSNEDTKRFKSLIKMPKKIEAKFENLQKETNKKLNGKLFVDMGLPSLRDPFIPYYDNIENELKEFDEIGKNIAFSKPTDIVLNNAKIAKCRTNQIALLLYELASQINPNPQKESIAILGEWITGLAQGSIKNELKESKQNLPIDSHKELVKMCKGVFGVDFCKKFDKYKNQKQKKKRKSKAIQ